LAIAFVFAGRAGFGCDFFFAELFGFAGALELFFFVEVAIIRDRSLCRDERSAY
jgi:hypothetical protein